MIKTIFILASFIFCKFSTAQSNLSIVYYPSEKKLNQFDDSSYNKRLPKQPNNHWILFAVRDSISYQTNYDPSILTEKKPLGSNFRGHSTYTDLSRNLVIIGVQPFGEQDCLIRDSIENLNWQFANTTKNILGYNCKKAFVINSQKKLIEVWYTPELITDMGPFGLNGLAGAILEIYFHQTGSCYSAQSLLKNTKEIVEPKKGRNITREEFREIMKRGRENRF